MQIVDTALKRAAEDGKPVKVALVGAGFMAKGLANQIRNSIVGMDLAAVIARRPQQAIDALKYAGFDDIRVVETPGELATAMVAGAVGVTDDYSVVTDNTEVDALLEVTGSIHYGAEVALAAIRSGKHVVLMNAELEGTIGSILKHYADENGVIISTADGDQPGVLANLMRFVATIGLRPLVAGNIKGLQDVNRNPDTQQGFAEQWGQNVHMVTSFADGTKISFEQAIVANAFDLTVAKRGMLGADWHDHIDGAVGLYDVDALTELGGVVDYVVGGQPGPGVYVFASHDDPKQQHYLDLFKLGKGPLYSFYTPYHLCHFEAPLSVARAVLFHDAVMSPLGRPRVDVATIAKVDLQPGVVIDRLGGFHSYGEAETHDVVAAQNLLPIGLAEGCTVKKTVAKGCTISYDDVAVPPGRLGDLLRAEQNQKWK